MARVRLIAGDIAAEWSQGLAPGARPENIVREKSFRKDLKRMKRRSKRNEEKLEEAMTEIVCRRIAPNRGLHLLIGKWRGVFSCDIDSDLRLLWRWDAENRRVIFIRVGSHADLYE